MDRRSLFPLLVVCFVLVAFQSSAWAQVQMILPSTSVVEESGDKKIRLDIRFAHPFKGNVVSMEKPNKFGVMRQGKKLDLMYLVKPIPVKGLQAFEVYYPINDPGDYVFYLQPNTWFDSTQKTLHVQPTKVVVNAYGEESGWDAELQEPAEILPLAQPYALWTGNSFRGVVKYRQKAVPFTKVHVVYFNEKSNPYRADLAVGRSSYQNRCKRRFFRTRFPNPAGGDSKRIFAPESAGITRDELIPCITIP